MPGGVGGGERPHYLPVREGGGPHSFFAFGLGLAFRVGQFSFFTLAHFSFIIDRYVGSLHQGDPGDH